MFGVVRLRSCSRTFHFMNWLVSWVMTKELPYETAHTIIQYHQNGALQFALDVSAQRVKENDISGARLWADVAEAIQEIQNPSRGCH